MKQSDVSIEVRDKDLNRKGVIQHEDLRFRIEDPHNNVGNWELELASDHPMAQWLRLPGSGVIVYNGSEVLASGPTLQPEFTSTPAQPSGMLKFTGVTDDILLADMLAWGDPTTGDMGAQTGATDTRVGNAESLLHAFVAANVGPAAIASRRDSRLIMGPNLGRGPQITKSANFEVLGEVLSGVAKVADLGFRIVQNLSNKLVFRTYAITDKRAEIRLDVLNGTLSAQKLTINAPEITHAIVMGKGRDREETDPEGFQPPKVPHLYTTPESIDGREDWNRRIERVVNATSTREPAELQQAALEVLTDKGFTTVSVQVSPMENSNMRYVDEWGVGDRIIVIVDGIEYTSLVTGFQMRIDNQGFFLGALLGDPADFDPRVALKKVVAQTGARISALERNG